MKTIDKSAVQVAMPVYLGLRYARSAPEIEGKIVQQTIGGTDGFGGDLYTLYVQADDGTYFLEEAVSTFWIELHLIE